MQKMSDIMSDFHRGLDTVGGETVIKTEDYSQGLNGLPKSDVLKYYTESGSVVIRPSGTEPKLKAYISAMAANKESAEAVEQRITADLERRL